MNAMNSCQLTAYITAIANALSSKLSTEETTLLAAVLVQLGDTLATIAAQRAIVNNLSETRWDYCFYHIFPNIFLLHYYIFVSSTVCQATSNQVQAFSDFHLKCDNP